MTQMVSSVVSGNVFGDFTYSDLPSSGVAQKAFPRSLCLTSHYVVLFVQHSPSSVRIMGSDGVSENVSS